MTMNECKRVYQRDTDCIVSLPIEVITRVNCNIHASQYSACHHDALWGETHSPRVTNTTAKCRHRGGI